MLDLVKQLLGDQRVRFLIVGGINTLLSTVFFWIYEYFWLGNLGDHGYILSLFVAYCTAMPIAYLLQRYLVFKVRGHFWLDFGRYCLVNSAGLALNNGLMLLAVDVCGLPSMWAIIPVTIIVIILTYLGHRFISFHRRPERKHDNDDAKAIEVGEERLQKCG
jgi:putative flippase GtrA